MLRTRLFVTLLLGTQAAAPAWAGRPLSVDDASVQDRGACQVETWRQRSDATREWHVAPACGVGADIEIGVEWVRFTPDGDDRSAAVLQAKSLLPSLDTAGWKFGIKAGYAAADSVAEERWESVNYGLTAIATRQFSAAYSLHLNIGAERRRREDDDSAATYGAALSWDGSARWSVFAELLGDDKTSATRIVGGRFWAIPGRLGIDLTGGNQAGVPDSTFMTLGMSLYDLGR